jgi:protein-L-isoaspartate(D-aspartate) O-methyltransferase
MAALMLQAASIRPDEHVLEVGTGSGYQAAVLSLLAKSVITVERIEQLRARSAERLRSAGYKEVEVHRAEEVVGWPAGAPYDAIIVAAGAPHVPRSLLRQLAQGGRLVIPVGDERAQELVVVCNEARGMTLVRLGACAFVLLIGHEAWETGTVRGFD